MAKLLVIAILLAPLAAHAQCGPDGMDSVCGPAKKVSTRPTLFVEDANTTFHFVCNGSRCSDVKSGATLTMHGTVPMVAASGLYPPGAGPFSSSNYWTMAGAGPFEMPNANANGFYVCFAMVGPGATTEQIFAGQSSGLVGWYAEYFQGNGGLNFGSHNGGGGHVVQVPSSALNLSGFNAICGGYGTASSGTLMVQANGMASPTTATGIGSYVDPSAVAPFIGFLASPAFAGTIYEIIVEAATPSGTVFTAQISHAKTATGN